LFHRQRAWVVGEDTNNGRAEMLLVRTPTTDERLLVKIPTTAKQNTNNGVATKRHGRWPHWPKQNNFQ